MSNADAKPLRVARFGITRYPLPPTAYGGTERSMSQMTIFQAAICGHDVTLYAAADSTIVDATALTARQLGLPFEIDRAGSSVEIQLADGRTGCVSLRTTGETSGFYTPEEEERRDKQLMALLLKDEQRHPFDIIHNHHKQFTTELLIPAGVGHKTLTHIHKASLESSYRRHRYPLICISRSQARALKKKSDANVYAVVPHGLDRFTYRATPTSAGYLAWMGRFSRKKGAGAAIAIARKANKPLMLAGVIHHAANQQCFDEDVRPFIDIEDHSLLERISHMTTPEDVERELASMADAAGCEAPVIFAGAASEAHKQALLGNAMATLFPISWPEPFGRVLIESMAVGAPVIGYVAIGATHCGAVEEVIEHGVTGFHIVARDEEEAVREAASAVAKLPELDRSEVRRVFERDWSAERLALQLDATYRRYLREQSNRTPGIRIRNRVGRSTSRLSFDLRRFGRKAKKTMRRLTT